MLYYMLRFSPEDTMDVVFKLAESIIGALFETRGVSGERVREYGFAFKI